MKLSRNWCGIFRDLVEVRASEAQVPQYAAVATGVRQALDDWVAPESLDDYRQVLARLSLSALVDCSFLPLSATDRIHGLDYSPTTRAGGSRYVSSIKLPKNAVVHVIVSSRQDWAEETLAAAWYPVAVNGRVLRKPLVDHARLGGAFGYPMCCVDYFVRENDWTRRNMFAEAAKRSSRICWEANCFRKLTPWMTIFHMPCAFDCAKTIEYSHAVLAATAEFDAGFAQEIRDRASRMCLVFSEGFACVLLNAKRSNQTIGYSGVEDLHEGAPNRKSYDYTRIKVLQAGDEIEIGEQGVLVRKGGQVLTFLKACCDDGAVEVPNLFEFV